MCSNSVPSQRRQMVLLSFISMSNFLLLFLKKGLKSRLMTETTSWLQDFKCQDLDKDLSPLNKRSCEILHIGTSSRIIQAFFFMQSWISLRNPLKWIKDKQFISKQTSESESTNVWKPNKQLTGFLRLWHVIERGKKKELLNSVPGIGFRFCQKLSSFQWAIPV